MGQGQLVWYGVLYLFAAFGLAICAAKLAMLWTGDRRIWRGNAWLWLDSSEDFDALLQTLQHLKAERLPKLQVRFSCALTEEQNQKLEQLGLLPGEKQDGRKPGQD